MNPVNPLPQQAQGQITLPQLQLLAAYAEQRINDRYPVSHLQLAQGLRMNLNNMRRALAVPHDLPQPDPNAVLTEYLDHEQVTVDHWNLHRMGGAVQYVQEQTFPLRGAATDMATFWNFNFQAPDRPLQYLQPNIDPELQIVRLPEIAHILQESFTVAAPPAEQDVQPKETALPINQLSPIVSIEIMPKAVSASKPLVPSMNRLAPVVEIEVRPEVVQSNERSASLNGFSEVVGIGIEPEVIPAANERLAASTSVHITPSVTEIDTQDPSETQEELDLIDKRMESFFEECRVAKVQVSIRKEADSSSSDVDIFTYTGNRDKLDTENRLDTQDLNLIKEHEMSLYKEFPRVTEVRVFVRKEAKGSSSKGKILDHNETIKEEEQSFSENASLSIDETEEIREMAEKCDNGFTSNKADCTDGEEAKISSSAEGEEAISSEVDFVYSDEQQKLIDEEYENGVTSDEEIYTDDDLSYSDDEEDVPPAKKMRTA